MMEKELWKIPEGRFDTTQIMVLMEFAFYLFQVRETEEYKKLRNAVAEISMETETLKTTLAELSKTLEGLSKDQEELKKPCHNYPKR